MKQIVRWIVLFGIVLLIAACGPGGAVVKVPAIEMNLSVEDLRESYTQRNAIDFEQLLELVKLEYPDKATDGHMRTFADQDSQLISVVLRFDSASTAKSALKDVKNYFEVPFQDEVPGLLFTELSAPEIGDDVVFEGAELLEQESRVYLIAFRKNNVIGMVVVVGPSDALDEIWISGLAQTMATRVPQAEE